MKNKQTKVNNPLISVFKLKKGDSNLDSKGHRAPKGQSVDVDGHLGKGADMKHKDTPHFPLQKPDNDVE